MFKLADHAVFHGYLNGNAISAGGIVEGFLGVGSFNLSLARGVGRQAEQFLLVQFVHYIYSELPEGGQRLGRVDIGENSFLVNFNSEDQGVILGNE